MLQSRAEESNRDHKAPKPPAFTSLAPCRTRLLTLDLREKMQDRCWKYEQVQKARTQSVGSCDRTPQTGAYAQRKFLSPSSEAWQARPGAAESVAGADTWPGPSAPSRVSSLVERTRQPIPFMKAPPSRPTTSQRLRFLMPSRWGPTSQHVNIWGLGVTNTQSVA